MTEPEFRRISAAVLALWPNSGWPDATISIAWSLLGSFEAVHVSKAVADLAKKGREFAPPPGVVYVYAQAVEREMRPQLPQAETTASDWDRSRRGVKEIMRQIADMATRRQMITTGKRQ